MYKDVVVRSHTPSLEFLNDFFPLKVQSCQTYIILVLDTGSIDGTAPEHTNRHRVATFFEVLKIVMTAYYG
jgi:hypothetical protein